MTENKNNTEAGVYKPGEEGTETDSMSEVFGFSALHSKDTDSGGEIVDFSALAPDEPWEIDDVDYIQEISEVEDENHEIDDFDEIVGVSELERRGETAGEGLHDLPGTEEGWAGNGNSVLELTEEFRAGGSETETTENKEKMFEPGATDDEEEFYLDLDVTGDDELLFEDEDSLFELTEETGEEETAVGGDQNGQAAKEGLALEPSETDEEEFLLDDISEFSLTDDFDLTEEASQADIELEDIPEKPSVGYARDEADDVAAGDEDLDDIDEDWDALTELRDSELFAATDEWEIEMNRGGMIDAATEEADETSELDDLDDEENDEEEFSLEGFFEEDEEERSDIDSLEEELLEKLDEYFGEDELEAEIHPGEDNPPESDAFFAGMAGEKETAVFSEPLASAGEEPGKAGEDPNAGVPLTQEQLEMALDRVIEKKFGETIEHVLNEIVSRKITDEIDSFKSMIADSLKRRG